MPAPSSTCVTLGMTKRYQKANAASCNGCSNKGFPNNHFRPPGCWGKASNESYLSFEYALGRHGLIPEAVHTYTSATCGKRKTHDSAIRSAFLKGNTRACLITLFSDDGVADAIMPGELLRIKLELDTDPAPHATFERQYRLLPSPYEVGLYDTPSLFAGKVHAVIARAWRSRVKGRDLYDYVF